MTKVHPVSSWHEEQKEQLLSAALRPHPLTVQSGRISECTCAGGAFNPLFERSRVTNAGGQDNTHTLCGGGLQCAAGWVWCPGRSHELNELLNCTLVCGRSTVRQAAGPRAPEESVSQQVGGPVKNKHSAGRRRGRRSESSFTTFYLLFYCRDNVAAACVLWRNPSHQRFWKESSSTQVRVCF